MVGGLMGKDSFPLWARYSLFGLVKSLASGVLGWSRAQKGESGLIPQVIPQGINRGIRLLTLFPDGEVPVRGLIPQLWFESTGSLWKI